MSIQSNVTLSATIRTRVHFSLHHLFAACRSASRIKELEVSNSDKELGDFWSEILQNALCVTTASVAALESYANELYFEGGVLKSDVPPAAALELASLIDKEAVLNKFAVAHTVRLGAVLDRGRQEVQDVQALIRLRNAVVHFRPEWADAPVDHARLSNVLRYKFETSPFLPGQPIFPMAWASASFGAWALRSTVGFLDYFFTQISATCPLAQFREKLSAASGGLIAP